jgi:hypothetical protein
LTFCALSIYNTHYVSCYLIFVGDIRNCSFARCDLFRSGRCVTTFQGNHLTPSRYTLLVYYNVSFCLPSLVRRLHFILRTVSVVLYFIIDAIYLKKFILLMVNFYLFVEGVTKAVLTYIRYA